MVLVAVVLTGCDSGGSTPSSGRGPDVAALSRQLEAQGPFTISGRSKADGNSGPITGVFDVTAKLGRVSIPAYTLRRTGQAEFRIVGTNAYLRRAVFPGGTLGGPPNAFVDPTGSGTWIGFGSSGSGLGGLILGAYVPEYLLNQVARVKPTWVSAGTARVGNRATHGWKAVLAVPGAVAALKALTLWTAGSDLARVDFTTTTGVTGRYDLVSARGVPHVKAPNASELVTSTAAEPVGPYTQVADGSMSGVTYHVFRSASSKGGTCWRVDATPAYDDPIARGADRHVCVPSLTESGDPADEAQFVVDASDRSVYEMIGALLPHGATAVLTMGDGTTRTLPVDANGLALYVGPPAPIAGYLEVTLADGTKLACGPGSVTSASDATGGGPLASDGEVDPIRQAKLRAQPWGCETFESLGR